MRERRGATWRKGIENDYKGARATPVERKKHAAFGTKEWNAIEHAVYEFFRHEGYKLSGDGKSAQARDLIQRLAAYGDVILNDEGADMTRVLRDLANMGAKGDVGKAREWYGKTDKKNCKNSG